MNTSAKHKPARATQFWFSDQKLYVRLEDGREIAAPLEWFPKLREASQHDLSELHFTDKDIGIHWESLDEDISVKRLLR